MKKTNNSTIDERPNPNRVQRILGKVDRKCLGSLAERGIYLSRSDRFLASLKDKHRGKRAFIIGSGPSLKLEDLDRLKNEITFGCNKIYLAFDQTDWRPTYYTVVDELVACQNREKIEELPLVKLMSGRVRHLFAGKSGNYYFRPLKARRSGVYSPKFSTDASLGCYGGGTVLYEQMQLAFHMGISEVFVIGLDFSFAIEKVAEDSAANGEVLHGRGEVNHFHPDYRKAGEAWSMPKLDIQRQAFACAKKQFEDSGRSIINASRSTKLDVFPLANFDSLF